MTVMTPPPGLPPIVSIIDVHKSFGTFKAVDGVSLDVASGEVVCIIGASGSGKTTLLRCINQLVQIDRGAIWVDGELAGLRIDGDKLYHLPEKEIARQRLATGMVFQRFNLFPHLTALENIIEAPIAGARQDRKREARGARQPCWRSVGLAATGRRLSRRSSPAASSSASPSPARSPCTPQPHAVRRADLGARSRAGRRGPRASCANSRHPA